MSDQTIPLSDKERADMLRMMYDEKVSELTAARAELNAANDLLNKQQERWAADLETARKEMDRATESSHQSLRRQAIDARAELETYRDSCAAKADRIDRMGETVVRLQGEKDTLAASWLLSAETNKELRAEVEALRADAERYRYLRGRDCDEVMNGRGPSAGVWCDMENEMGTLVLVTGDDLDAEVDAARAALAKEKAS